MAIIQPVGLTRPDKNVFNFNAVLFISKVSKKGLITKRHHVNKQKAQLSLGKTDRKDRL